MLGSCFVVTLLAVFIYYFCIDEYRSKRNDRENLRRRAASLDPRLTNNARTTIPPRNQNISSTGGTLSHDPRFANNPRTVIPSAPPRSLSGLPSYEEVIYKSTLN